MYRIIFSRRAEKELKKNKNDILLIRKLYQILNDVEKHPFDGLGKPEQLRGDLSGLWSRRLDKKSRLIYEVIAPDILIISFIGHYE